MFNFQLSAFRNNHFVRLNCRLKINYRLFPVNHSYSGISVCLLEIVIIIIITISYSLIAIRISFYICLYNVLTMSLQMFLQTHRCLCLHILAETKNLYWKRTKHTFLRVQTILPLERIVIVTKPVLNF